ncbi:acetolactate synthase small subunit, partial [Mycobacterium tuberculosis]
MTWLRLPASAWTLMSANSRDTECKDRSRMTIVVSAEDTPLEQITKQLNKLINVIKIVEQDDEHSVSRELALIKVQADAGSRSQVIEA